MGSENNSNRGRLIEELALVQGLKSMQSWIGSNEQRKQHEKMVVDQEIIYTEDAAQVKLKHRFLEC